MTDDIYDRGILISVWNDWQRRWSCHELPDPPSNDEWPRPRPNLYQTKKKKKKKPRRAKQGPREIGYQNWSPNVEVHRAYAHYGVVRKSTDWKGRPPVKLIPHPTIPGLYYTKDQ